MGSMRSAILCESTIFFYLPPDNCLAWILLLIFVVIAVVVVVAVVVTRKGLKVNQRSDRLTYV